MSCCPLAWSRQSWTRWSNIARTLGNLSGCTMAHGAFNVAGATSFAEIWCVTSSMQSATLDINYEAQCSSGRERSLSRGGKSTKECCGESSGWRRTRVSSGATLSGTRAMPLPHSIALYRTPPHAMPPHPAQPHPTLPHLTLWLDSQALTACPELPWP